MTGPLYILKRVDVDVNTPNSSTANGRSCAFGPCTAVGVNTPHSCALLHAPQLCPAACPAYPHICWPLLPISTSSVVKAMVSKQEGRYPTRM